MVDALTSLLTSEARARVLTALYGQPGRAYYQQELAREAAVPLVAVQRELRRLVPAGFVRVSEVGGRRLYQADPDCSVFGELQAIVLKLRGVASRIRQALAEEKDVRSAWIFGSFAAGTAGASSDIDLMVVGTPEGRRLRTALGRVERTLRRTINEHIVTPQEWSARLRKGDGFLRQVRRGPKLWIVGGESGLRQLERRSPR